MGMKGLLKFSQVAALSLHVASSFLTKVPTDRRPVQGARVIRGQDGSSCRLSWFFLVSAAAESVIDQGYG
jgi:hypothetical protein